MVHNLNNHVAIITGAGKGIGRAISMLLAQNGATVIASDKDVKTARQTVELCPKGQHLAIETDVTSESSICDTFKMVLNKYGRVDIVVSNAGIFKPTPILELTADEWDLMMSINLRGTFIVGREAFRAMKDQRYGKIINIASTAGKTAGANNGAHYAVSKAGVICFTKSLARQAAPFNINVNAVCPGPTETDMVNQWDPKSKAMVLNQIPLNRFSSPIDIANGVLFLASDYARNVTGEILDVNGGMIMD